MDVKCPVCDRTVTSEKVGDLSGTLRQHLEDEHGFSGFETEAERKVRTFKETETLSPEARIRAEEVAQFKEPRAGQTTEERAVETFSGREPSAESAETRREVEKVTQFQTPRGAENKEECQTRTFSESQCVGMPEESQVLKEEVRQWKYPRVGPEGERGPAFQCPVCGETMAASDEESLSVELKEHFTEVHELEKVKIENR